MINFQIEKRKVFSGFDCLGKPGWDYKDIFVVYDENNKKLYEGSSNPTELINYFLENKNIWNFKKIIL